MPAERFLCEDCGKRFTRISNLHRHQRTTHGSELSHCQTCGKRLIEGIAICGILDSTPDV